VRAQGIADERVIERSQRPAHLFVDEALASRAYEDTALPIGCGQTISQPYVVARMCEALCAGGQPGKVLEIGTGCGYRLPGRRRSCVGCTASSVWRPCSRKRAHDSPTCACTTCSCATARMARLRSNAPYDGIS
jgi:trans-2-enoyl-CoA reductase